MSTAERLQGYYPFSQEVIDTVSEVAEMQQSFTNYRDFFDQVGISPETKQFLVDRKPTEIIDIRPKEHDPRSAMVIHLAMANPLDPNQLFQIGTIAAANPNRRIIAAGNPSGGNYHSGHLRIEQRAAVRRGSLDDAVDPVLFYARRTGVEQMDSVGYSYGADRALVAAASFDTDNIVAIEPASITKRRLGRLTLGLQFARSNAALKTYTDATGLEIFDDARHDMSSLGMASYVRGLVYPTNLAIAKYIASGRFKESLTEALECNKASRAVVAWGTESELSDDAKVREIVHWARDVDFPGRIKSIRIKGAKHALANDVHLQAAIVNQALLSEAA